MGIVKRYEIRNVLDSIQVAFVFSVGFLLAVILTVPVVLFLPNTTPSSFSVEELLLFSPISIVILLMVYGSFQISRSCNFEIREDRLIQKFLKPSFGRVTKDKVILYNTIEAYKSYSLSERGNTGLYLYIKLQNSKKEKIRMAVGLNTWGSSRRNYETFGKMIDDFIFCLEYYVENHPDDYPEDKRLRFQKDNLGWIRLNRISGV